MVTMGQRSSRHTPVPQDEPTDWVPDTLHASKAPREPRAPDPVQSVVAITHRVNPFMHALKTAPSHFPVPPIATCHIGGHERYDKGKLHTAVLLTPRTDIPTSAFNDIMTRAMWSTVSPAEVLASPEVYFIQSECISRASGIMPVLVYFDPDGRLWLLDGIYFVMRQVYLKVPTTPVIKVTRDILDACLVNEAHTTKPSPVGVSSYKRAEDRGEWTH